MELIKAVFQYQVSLGGVTIQEWSPDSRHRSPAICSKRCNHRKIQKANVTFWLGSRQGVLYRRQFFDYNLQNESMWIQAMNLADFPVQNGIFRVDKHKLFRRPVIFTLGAYGFPDNGTKIIKRSCKEAEAIERFYW